MNQIAENYVKLVLEIGLYRPEYVDAYYGPVEWKPAATSKKNVDSTLIFSLNKKTDDFLNKLDELSEYNATEIETFRYRFLYKQLLSIKGMIAIISGAEFTFEKETQILYDADPPKNEREHFSEILNELDSNLPGEGNLTGRYNNFKDQFIFPKGKLDSAFTLVMNECRNRTMNYITLPQNEKFEIEYVSNKPWGAYNWFKGNLTSIIQVNTDLPLTVDRVIELAAHEGYPGHHLFNSLIEQKLVKERGWTEYSVYPLYSPISLIAEGTANFGEKLIFPIDSKNKFMKEVLFPYAGLDTNLTEKYQKVIELVDQLGYAGNEAARNYLNGIWAREETLKFLMEYSLHSKERAEKKIEFIEFYRSYIINYNYGYDLVNNYIEVNGGTENDLRRRWELFEKLLTTPQTPSGLLNY
ncbi:MAG: hypothetical protein HKP17_03960 [Ignavibacteriaceae bacterium]|nr:hypothetical protein [Ignavibacteria bacterium]MBT8390797.1 hypothetical protein [Ignavibacteria bacterium]NNJ52299.1 hypothetical protein [Ignavibacteriaceae bacterium]NNL20169.1 hypothetical protein [Ignavibacteriaceae bacterium]